MCCAGSRRSGDGVALTPGCQPLALALSHLLPRTRAKRLNWELILTAPVAVSLGKGTRLPEDKERVLLQRRKFVIRARGRRKTKTVESRERNDF